MRSAWRARWRSFVYALRGDMNRDVEDEFGFHIAERTEALVGEGVERREAERRARLEFGSEAAYSADIRAQRGVAWLDEVRAELLYASRQLRGAPLTYAVAVIVLAVPFALLMTTAAFVDGVLLKPLPVAGSERVVGLWERGERASTTDLTRVAPPVLLRWQRESAVLESVAGWSEESVAYADAERAWRLEATATTPELFSLYGHPPALGRYFAADENQAGAERVVVLTHELWSSLFASDSAIIGRAIALDGVPHTVVGVAPPAMTSLHAPSDLFVPLAPYIAGAEDIAGAKFLLVAARMRPGVDAVRVRTALERATRDVDGNEGWHAAVVPFRAHLTAGARGALLLWLAAGGALMLVAVCNASGLFLTRMPRRMQELTLRRALGASSGRLFRQMLVESLLVGAIACALGAGLSYALLHVALRASPVSLPRLAEIHIDERVLLFGGVVILLVVAVQGAAPAVVAARSTRRSVVTESPRIAGARSRRTAAVLATGEIAATLAVIGAAALLFASFRTIMAIDPGFRAQDITTVDLSLAPHRFETSAEWGQFAHTTVQQLNDALSATVAVSNNLPIGGRNITSPLIVEGRTDVKTAPRAHVSTVSAAFFDAVDIAVTRGRAFTDADAAGAAPVAILSHSLAQQLFPGESAIGKRVRSMFGAPVMREVVGIVEDVHHTLLTEEPGAVLYVPFAQDPKSSFAVVIRSSQPGGVIANTVMSELRRLEPEQPITRIVTMEELLRDSVSHLYFVLRLLTVFALVSLCVALAGIYATMAAMVAARSRELAVRSALGAPRVALLRMIMSDGGRIVLGGIAFGVPLLLAGSPFLRSFLFGVTPQDPLVMTSIVLFVAGAAMLGMLHPALVAARVDPVTVLRR